MSLPFPPSSSELIPSRVARGDFDSAEPFPEEPTTEFRREPTEVSSMFFAEGVTDAPSVTMARDLPMLPLASSYVAPHWAGVEELPETTGMPIVVVRETAALEDVLDVAEDTAAYAARRPVALARNLVVAAVVCAGLGAAPTFAADVPAESVAVLEKHAIDRATFTLAGTRRALAALDPEPVASQHAPRRTARARIR
ncbi:MAG: hypothetical protein U0169_15245 [Polyangiaceae bacterium]